MGAIGALLGLTGKTWLLFPNSALLAHMSLGRSLASDVAPATVRVEASGLRELGPHGAAAAQAAARRLAGPRTGAAWGPSAALGHDLYIYTYNLQPS